MSASHEPALWRPEIAPATLILAPAPAGFDVGPLDPSSFSRVIANRRDGDDRHLILADADGDHRLWLHGVEAGRRPP
ncbi:DUF7012 domain-containing protein [Methylocella tundrae]|uniref:DUF7012 domain-containing protein n=1 Tax=Methylocella tundrae TaxID=227605 RepID=UPI003CC7E8FC